MSDGEDKAIDGFLKKNFSIHFSTLARTAVTPFVEQPMLKIEPIRRRHSVKKSISL